MAIFIDIVSKNDLVNSLLETIKADYRAPKNVAEYAIKKYLVPHLDNLIDDLTCVVSSPYIDRVYRDSYYTYYSSKLTEYNRDCIRVSFFTVEVTQETFRKKKNIDLLQENFGGFIIIRPTDPQIIGRSTINPKIVKNNNFFCCTSSIGCTINSIKLTVKGFPHSSQDSETISCAETTLWAIMEYFATKYPEYKPVLPSKIIEVLRQISSERQLPSKGLSIQQIAYALREFDFGTRVYNRKEYQHDFKKLLSTYIESGIPIIVAIDDFGSNGSTGHAALCIGRVGLEENMIDSLSSLEVDKDSYLGEKVDSIGIELFDFHDIDKEFVFNDDNFPAYQKANLDSPTKYYGDSKKWKNCEITNFIVPLYPKIYLEAYEANNFCKELFFALYSDFKNAKKLVLRLFLASTRSYKQFIAWDEVIDSEVKDIILGSSMPKFIWLLEISDKTRLKSEKATGLMIVDATEANVMNIKPLIFSYFKGITYCEDPKSRKLKKIPLNSTEFSMYTKNLNIF